MTIHIGSSHSPNRTLCAIKGCAIRVTVIYEGRVAGLLIHTIGSCQYHGKTIMRHLMERGCTVSTRRKDHV